MDEPPPARRMSPETRTDIESAASIVPHSHLKQFKRGFRTLIGGSRDPQDPRDSSKYGNASETPAEEGGALSEEEYMPRQRDFELGVKTRYHRSPSRGDRMPFTTAEEESEAVRMGLEPGARDRTGPPPPPIPHSHHYAIPPHYPETHHFAPLPIPVRDVAVYGREVEASRRRRASVDSDENGMFADRRNENHPFTVTREYTEQGAYMGCALVIDSPILIEALRDHVSPSRDAFYSRLYCRRVSIPEPYVLIFLNRRRLLAAVGNGAEGDRKVHLLRLLLDHLKNRMPVTWQTLDDLEAGTCTHIAFRDAWLLYPPGTTAYSHSAGAWEAHKVEEVVVKHFPGMESLRIHGYRLVLDADGSKLVPEPGVLRLCGFGGVRAISKLKIVPEAHATNRDQILRSLDARGKTYWGFHGQPAYRRYVGKAWPIALSSDSVRVVVDYVTPSRHGGSRRHGYWHGGGGGGDDHEDGDDDDDEGKDGNDDNALCDCPICARKYAGLDSYPAGNPTVDEVCLKDEWTTATTIEEKRSYREENPFIFCPSGVWAFSLKHKSWSRVEVEKIETIDVPSDPFKKLVLEDAYKKVVESMVEQPLSTVSDVIREKGRGVVILLHGGPGTGKSLTVECVAEKKLKPLYAVTCGDLGTNPDLLEKRLNIIFLRAVHWNAVLLLDEADVFLQERDLHDLKRNALVSVFLRHIEYYDGVLFLTTNRPGQIDEAFQSRIHVTLCFPELDFRRQKLVWQTFINNLSFEESTNAVAKKKELLLFVRDELEGRLKRLDDYQMNGRQIKNCIRAAAAIAKRNGRDVVKEDILQVIELGSEFRGYMAKVNHMNAEEKAHGLGLRYTMPN